MSQTPPNHERPEPATPPDGSGAPGDAGGPDIFSGESGPISPPRAGEAADANDYHPERGYVGSSGGLGGGDAMGTTTTRTSAGAPVQGYAGPHPPSDWSGLPAGDGGDAPEAASSGLGDAGPARGENLSEDEQRLDAASPPRGSAAPEHDVAMAPGVSAAGAHGWPLPSSGAPSVTSGAAPHPGGASASRGPVADAAPSDVDIAGEPGA
ncbi:MAG: hypothetical protein IVW57_14980 [Ktedonobacterales bacterium]|nr:hypothetical protein [Ktedonobacterales bacterium]